MTDPTPQATPTLANNPTPPPDPTPPDPRLSAATPQDAPACVACDFKAEGGLAQCVKDVFGDKPEPPAMIKADEGGPGIEAALRRMADRYGRPFNWPKPATGVIALYAPIMNLDTEEVAGHRVVVWL